MLLRCVVCDKAVSTPVPDDTVIRGTIECPECTLDGSEEEIPEEVCETEEDLSRIQLNPAIGLITVDELTELLQEHMANCVQGAKCKLWSEYWDDIVATHGCGPYSCGEDVVSHKMHERYTKASARVCG